MGWGAGNPPGGPINPPQPLVRVAPFSDQVRASSQIAGASIAVAVDRIRRLEAFEQLHQDCAERLDGISDERDELLVRCDELKAELDVVRAERDTARAVGL